MILVIADYIKEILESVLLTTLLTLGILTLAFFILSYSWLPWHLYLQEAASCSRQHIWTPPPPFLPCRQSAWCLLCSLKVCCISSTHLLCTLLFIFFLLFLFCLHFSVLWPMLVFWTINRAKKKKIVKFDEKAAIWIRSKLWTLITKWMNVAECSGNEFCWCQ